MPTILPSSVSLGEKPKKFNGLNFKQWQQKILFYLTTLNLARFLTEDATQLKEDEHDIQVISAIDAWKHYDFLCQYYVMNGLADSVASLYPTWPGGQTKSGDADQFYHIYIFEYCRNKCRIIISIKEGPPFCQLTLSFNMACMPFQHYHLQNIIRVHLHK